MVLDRSGTDEELAANVLVRAPVARKIRNLLFLGCQRVIHDDGAPAHPLAGGQKLAARTLGKASGSNFGKQVKS